MRLYELLNFQDIMGFLFPTLLFMVIFGLFLAYSHFSSHNAEARKEKIFGRYAEGIEDRNAPFPLAMILVVAGVFIWGFFYIVMHGVLGVKI
jgi:amino acid transporter